MSEQSRRIKMIRTILPFLEDEAEGKPDNIEELLMALLKVCTKKEGQLINQMLNMIRMKKMMELFNMMNMMKNQGEGEGDMTDILMSQLSPEQKDNFEMMKTMMEMMNSTQEVNE